MKLVTRHKFMQKRRQHGKDKNSAKFWVRINEYKGEIIENCDA